MTSNNLAQYFRWNVTVQTFTRYNLLTSFNGLVNDTCHSFRNLLRRVFWVLKWPFRSLNVIGNDTVRWKTYDFLLTFHSNYARFDPLAEKSLMISLAVSIHYMSIRLWKMYRQKADRRRSTVPRYIASCGKNPVM